MPIKLRHGALAATVLAVAFLSGCIRIGANRTSEATAPVPPANVAAPVEGTAGPRTLAAAPATPGATSCTDPNLTVFNGRVIAVGDSLGQGLTQVLMNSWDTPTFTNLTTNSSGLARPDFFDTIGRFSGAADAAQPGDIAVIWLGANDNQSLLTITGGVAAYAANPDDWRTEYAARVATMAGICVVNGIDCYWLLPAASDASVDGYVNHRARMEEIRDIILGVVSGNPTYASRVHIVDVWNIRDIYPGFDPAHPGMSGLTQAASMVTSAVATTRGVCMR